jgi:3-carboxy-cis,cis-muconate cycloisomerase
MFDGVLARGRVAPAVADERWLRAMLDAEAALAWARGMPAEVVDAIGAARLDARELGARAAESGNPVVPLVEALRELAGPEVHRGATSQDILDTAAMLVARRARELILGELDGVVAACKRLADEHRATVMTGRTLMQAAQPVTFGLKAAFWLDGVASARERLRHAELAVQLGGPVGIHEPAVIARFAERLELG